MMSMKYLNPCECCRDTLCVGLECDRWRKWYFHRQRLINAWAQRKAPRREVWMYPHPEELAHVAARYR